MRTFEDFRNAKDQIGRTIYYINGLSPHNLWKADEAIDELIRQNQLQLLEELEKKSEIFPERGIGSIEPVRAVRLSAIEEMKRKVKGE